MKGKRFWVVRMIGSYESSCYFPFWEKKEAETFIIEKEKEKDNQKLLNNSWYEVSKREYWIEEYKGELMSQSYAE